jgi:hypothetical protein
MFGPLEVLCIGLFVGLIFGVCLGMMIEKAKLNRETVGDAEEVNLP